VSDHFDNEVIQAPAGESLPRRIGTPAPHFSNLPATRTNVAGRQRAVRIAPHPWWALAREHKAGQEGCRIASDLERREGEEGKSGLEAS